MTAKTPKSTSLIAQKKEIERLNKELEEAREREEGFVRTIKRMREHIQHYRTVIERLIVPMDVSE